jgi:hypothetical protein
MKNMLIENQFPNYGFFMVEFNEDELQPVKNEIDEIYKANFLTAESANDRLVGQIEHEYVLKKCHKHLESLILPYLVEYDKKFKYLGNLYFVLNEDRPISLQEPWVNFQKKHEFNPIHHHNGLFSFVLWIDIPYSIEEENNSPLCKKARSKLPGHFQFIYTNSLGHISSYDIPADKTYNNKMVIFPASLSHAVYPFSTSDKYRISVSGNFIFNVT